MPSAIFASPSKSATVLGVNVDVVPDAVMNVCVFFFISTPALHII
jgi:hypothetical protein